MKTIRNHSGDEESVAGDSGDPLPELEIHAEVAPARGSHPSSNQIHGRSLIQSFVCATRGCDEISATFSQAPSGML